MSKIWTDRSMLLRGAEVLTGLGWVRHQYQYTRPQLVHWDNGLLPAGIKPLFENNMAYYSLDTWEQIAMKFKYEFNDS